MSRFLFFAAELYALPILRPLERAIRSRGHEAAWFVLGAAGRYLRAEEKRLDTVDAVKAYRPWAVFVPGNWVPDFFPGIKVEIFHGFNVQKRGPSKGHFRVRGFFDLYCTQGPDTTGPFLRLADRHGYFRVVETGWPKLDPLFTGNADSPAKPGRRPVVLYTSTFSEALTSSGRLYEEIRRQAATGRWDWIVTFHPKMAREVVQRYKGLESANLRFFDTEDVIPLLRRADVMLSDTSSIVSEFLVLHKPVVTFRNRAPGPHVVDVSRPEAIGPAIETAMKRPPELLAAIREYARRIHPYRDGRSSHRVLEALEEFSARGREGLRRKPVNLWRKIRARRALGYYRVR